MAPRPETKEKVFAALIAAMERGVERGEYPMAAAEAEYPDVPHGVIVEAWCKFDDDMQDRWWDSIEKTIEGEIVRRALKADTGESA